MKKLSAVLVFLSFAVMVTVNALANILPLNGVNTGTLSDEIPNLFVPAGITFSIWGLIYLLLLGYSVAVLRQGFSRSVSGNHWKAADGFLFAANAFANTLWVICWHWRFVSLSFVVMLVILGTLILLQERNFRRTLASQATVFDRVFLAVPINVYLGWICMATIANATAVLVTLGWNGFGLGEQFWAVTVIIAGFAVALGLAFKRRAVAAPLVVVWAYAGIVIKRLSVDAEQTRAVWFAAIAASVLILCALMVVRVMKKKTA